MASETVSAASLLARAEVAWAGGDGEAAMAFYGRAVDLAEADGDLQTRVAAVLGLARGQQYNLTPGPLPVRLHAAYDASTEPGPRAQLAAALAPAPRCPPLSPAAGPTPTSRSGPGPSRSRPSTSPTAWTTRSSWPTR